MLGDQDFLLGFLAGILVFQPIFIGLFLWYGYRAREAIKRYLDEYEAEEKQRRGLK
jgi:hypothetical protein